MATRKKIEADPKGKLKFSSPLDMMEHDIEKAPASAMQEKDPFILPETERAIATTPQADPEMVPAIPMVDRLYPGLRDNQNIPKILFAILTELVDMRHR